MKKILILVLILISANLFAQEKEKTNPIIFSEISYGVFIQNKTGFSIIGTLNYQKNNHLFTYRYINQVQLKAETLNLGLIILPFPVFSKKIIENSFLYGKRYVNNNLSKSFSFGVSYTHFQEREENEFLLPFSHNYFWGIPLEFNIKWFKPKKKRFRIYYLIPVGKPTGLGGSIGFKLFGNISKKSYVGIGLTFGLGYYKNYN